MRWNFVLLVCAAIFFQASCERHPASQTVPGYAEKSAGQEAEIRRAATTPITINPAGPKFFPSGQ